MRPHTSRFFRVCRESHYGSRIFCRTSFSELDQRSIFGMMCGHREKLKQLLSLSPNTVLEYKKHCTSIKDNSTFRNAKLYVAGAS